MLKSNRNAQPPTSALRHTLRRANHPRRSRRCGITRTPEHNSARLDVQSRLLSAIGRGLHRSPPARDPLSPVYAPSRPQLGMAKSEILNLLLRWAGPKSGVAPALDPLVPGRLVCSATRCNTDHGVRRRSDPGGSLSWAAVKVQVVEMLMPYHGRMPELVFEVVQESDGGYCAECLTENIFTEGDTWEELRKNVLEATSAFFFDRPRPERLRLHLIRDESLVGRMRIPRDVSGRHLADVLCREWQYIQVNQVGSHIILQTSEPAHQRISRSRSSSPRDIQLNLAKSSRT